MSKRTVFTTISPLPPGIGRALVLDFLHDHEEMIDLNPLVRERRRVPPPADAPADEHRCTWYAITDKIAYLPGGLASGDVSYTCAFYDLPSGIQTHCRAPLGVDIRERWTLNGTLPGEPPEPVELGLGAPSAGLYLREDVDLRCNILTAGFVKKNLKRSHAKLVEHLIAKAKRLTSAAPAAPAARGRSDSDRPGAGAGEQPLPPSKPGSATPPPPPSSRGSGAGVPTGRDHQHSSPPRQQRRRQQYSPPGGAETPPAPPAGPAAPGARADRPPCPDPLRIGGPRGGPGAAAAATAATAGHHHSSSRDESLLPPGGAGAGGVHGGPVPEGLRIGSVGGGGGGPGAWRPPEHPDYPHMTPYRAGDAAGAGVGTVGGGFIAELE